MIRERVDESFATMYAFVCSIILPYRQSSRSVPDRSEPSSFLSSAGSTFHHLFMPSIVSFESVV